MAHVSESPREPLTVCFASSDVNDCLQHHTDAIASSLFSSFLDKTSRAIVILDCSMEAVASNDKALGILGRKDVILPVGAAGLIGRAAVNRIDMLFSGPGDRMTASFEVNAASFGGSQDIHITAHRLTDQAMRTVGIALELSEKLVDSARMANFRPQRVEALGLYVAGIVHEFDNLLAVIGGRAGLGLMADAPGAKNRALENVITAARRAEHITRNLLTYVQRLEPEFMLVDLAKPIAEAVSLLEIEFAAAHVEVRMDFVKIRPVTCDPVQISQACFNLLHNARNAMPEGGAIMVTLREEDEHAVITVADSGKGIPAELLTRIFDPFISYGRRSSRKPSGTGLGLFITKEIVLAHGGDISIRSAPGEGATFIIRIPLRRELTSS